jgi:hypothetical protein
VADYIIDVAERAVRNGATLQWQEKDGRWMTPRDRETMLRILREDPTRTYRILPAGVRACLCGQPISDECAASGCRWDKEKNRG